MQLYLDFKVDFAICIGYFFKLIQFATITNLMQLHMPPKLTSTFSQTATGIPPKSNVKREDKDLRETAKINRNQLFTTF